MKFRGTLLAVSRVSYPSVYQNKRSLYIKAPGVCRRPTNLSTTPSGGCLHYVSLLGGTALRVDADKSRFGIVLVGT